MTAEQRTRLAALTAELARQDAITEEAKRWLGVTEADIDCARFAPAIDDLLDRVFAPAKRAASAPPSSFPHAVRV